MEPILFPNWRDQVTFSPDGPKPQVLMENEKLKVVVDGFEPGQRIPPHPEGESMFHFLKGTGWMVVEGERLSVKPSATVVTPAGAKRGIETEARLAFLAARVA
jgi:quercetin dioxygenase-like cupin family protein